MASCLNVVLSFDAGPGVRTDVMWLYASYRRIAHWFRCEKSAWYDNAGRAGILDLQA